MFLKQMTCAPLPSPQSSAHQLTHIGETKCSKVCLRTWKGVIVTHIDDRLCPKCVLSLTQMPVNVGIDAQWRIKVKLERGSGDSGPVPAVEGGGS